MYIDIQILRIKEIEFQMFLFSTHQRIHKNEHHGQKCDGFRVKTQYM